MACLLFECLSEEMPVKMQHYAEKRARNVIELQLKAFDLAYTDLMVFVSARRITIVVNGLIDKITNKYVYIRGPRVGAPQKAIDGFLGKLGKKESDLEVQNTSKGEFYFIKYLEESVGLKTKLKKTIEYLLSNFEWPKSMRWSSIRESWIRPITNLLCVCDGDVIPVRFAGIEANQFTYGHKFISPKKLLISSYEDYCVKLQENYVVYNQTERLSIIKNKSISIAEQNGLQIKFDEGLLNELNGLVEYPNVLLGKIDDCFMSLPEEVLVIVMKQYQRYHYLLTQGGELASFFIFVSNNNKDTHVISGNEKVLKARLADAKFLIEQDLQYDLSHYGAKLSSIVFHSKLGSMQDKVDRVLALSKYVSLWVPGASLLVVEEAAKLIKADLATAIVREFPELQGDMGSYYGGCQKYSDDVLVAIKEHYYPLQNSDVCTNNPVAITLAIADKIDTIVGMFSVSENISSSRDPFGVKRLGVGVIKTIVANNLMLPLGLVIEQSIKLYPGHIFKKMRMLKIKNQDHGDDKILKSCALKNIRSFLYNRFKAHLYSSGVGDMVIGLVTDKNYVINKMYRKVVGINNYLQSRDGGSLVNEYKRVHNILSSAEKGRKTKIRTAYNPAFFLDEHETKIASALMEAKSDIKNIMKEDSLHKALERLERIKVGDFIDNVLINHKVKTVRNNRLKLLSHIRYLFNQVIQFKDIV